MCVCVCVCVLCFCLCVFLCLCVCVAPQRPFFNPLVDSRVSKAVFALKFINFTSSVELLYRLYAIK